MAKTIQLANGKGKAVVDDSDYKWLNNHKWCIVGKGYAKTAIYDCDTKKQRHILMHRMIMGLERGDGRRVDHINRNRLDNRRENLRIASTSTNLRNRRKFKNSKSQYKGVSWNSKHNQWEVAIRAGLFEDELEAALFYDTIMRKIFPDAPVNFPDDGELSALKEKGITYDLFR